jgi:hypothetical protein
LVTPSRTRASSASLTGKWRKVIWTFSSGVVVVFIRVRDATFVPVMYADMPGRTPRCPINGLVTLTGSAPDMHPRAVMATKGENHRADQQRANQSAKPKRAPAKLESHADKAGVRGTAAQNLKTAPSHVKDGPALEDSSPERPSRKSTRGSTGHIKLGTNLQRRQIRRVHSPEARAARNAVR